MKTKNSFFNQPKKVLIIGFGRMGRLLVKVFLRETKALVFVLSGKKRTSKQKRLCFLNNWQNLPKVDLIIPCVPISVFEKCMKKINKNIKSACICLDVCSVKVHPVKTMKKFLPKHIKIIASHPMFGPDSYKVNCGLKNLKIVLNNVTADKKDYQSLKSFFKFLGLKNMEISPEQHDLYMAHSLGFSYLIGKINNLLKIKKTPIDTYDFSLLLEQTEIVACDSDQLFLDMQKYNPFAKKVRNKFLKTSRQLINKLNKQA
ncbi:prephenate dehydrogenase/arogenate dehydrogenase family protein [Candidatus Microgenomates bacterium]|nr:prephenate dehydrogenase/arogenate dehydrogenase family protein [Candidatus Microgenomates bacterium]